MRGGLEQRRRLMIALGRLLLAIIRSATIIRWPRAGFRLYWRRRTRARGRHPKIDQELRALTREISAANPVWGALRIRGESSVPWRGLCKGGRKEELRMICNPQLFHRHAI